MNTKTNLLKSIFIALILVMGVTNVWADVTFTEEAVIYFTMENDNDGNNWWNNSGCYHYATFKGASGTTSATVHLYNISSRSSSASAQTNPVFFATIPAGTYSKISFYRGKTAATLSFYHNAATDKVDLQADKNKFGTIYNDNFGDWQSWSKTQETSTVTLSASSNNVNENDVVTLTPSLTTNADLNKIKSVSYSIAPNSGASIDGNEFKATAAGTYTVTATITYNAKGYTDITKTTTATETITVTAASGHKITYEEGDLWTYTNNPASAEKGALVKFDVTPNAGYSLKVTSEDVNVSNSNGNTYTFTMPDKDVTINVTAEEILTEVTINVNPDGSGILKVGGNDFVAGEKVNVGVAATEQVVVTPVPGYKFSDWSTTGNATNTGSTAQTTLKGNGTGGKGTLTATLARTYAFIQGRFRVYNSGRTAYTTTYAAGGQWEVKSTNLKMEYDEIKHQHFLRTYMTPKELSETHGKNCGECIPFFYIKTSTSETKFESETSYKSNSSVELKTAGDKKTLYNHTGSTDANNANLKFNSTDDSGYAILYFDEASVWYELEYELKYDANGGTGTAPGRTYHSSGATATTAAANTFTNTNGTFKEWNTKQDGTGDSYGAGSTITITRNTTLYAQWLGSNPTYTITFDKQSGDGGTGSATVQYQNNNYNPATVGAPTRANYTFGGYYTQAEGAGVQVVSASGEWLKSVTGYTDASGNWIKNSGVTLYAKWISNSTATEGLPTNVYLVGSFG